MAATPIAEEGRTRTAEAVMSRLEDPTGEIAKVWETFITEITAIPRKSGSEGPMVQYIKAWASEIPGAIVEHDEQTNNVLVRVPSTLEHDTPSILFQGHMDMICVQDVDSDVNPATDGVIPVVDDDHEWIHADKTTLGADNGIALAVMRSLATTQTPHGEMGFLFTTSEETGLDGAKGLNFDLSDYTYLVNLDSEKANEAIIGCAGGGDVVLDLPINTIDETNKEVVTVSLENLLGGHSGLEINQNRANAIKLLVSLIKSFQAEHPSARLVNFQGGSMRNAIPKAADAAIALDADEVQLFSEYVHEAVKLFLESHPEETMFAATISEPEHCDSVSVLDEESGINLINLLTLLPNGVLEMNEHLAESVQTSVNLAIVKQDEDGFHITSMARSSIKEHLNTWMDNIARSGLLHGATFSFQGQYPGWEPKQNDQIVDLVRGAYGINHENLEINVTHGGLECGVILEYYPHLHAISIGPTIEGAHTTHERLHIKSTENLYKILQTLLRVVGDH